VPPRFHINSAFLVHFVQLLQLSLSPQSANVSHFGGSPGPCGICCLLASVCFYYHLFCFGESSVSTPSQLMQLLQPV